MLEILQPYITEILDALKTAIIGAITLGGALVLAWMRAKYQNKIIAAEVRVEEKKAWAQTSAGGAKVPGAAKKANVLGRVTQKLPWHAKPLPLFGGAERMIDRNVEKLRRESMPPEAK
jgi:hypothetical protein